MAQKTDLTYLDIKAAASLVKIDAESAYQFVQGEISWQDVLATEIALDPDTLNKYLRDDTISLSDVLSATLEKSSIDSFGFTDSQVVEVQKAVTDALSFTDSVEVVLVIQRAFADSFSISDVSTITIDKRITDTLTMSDLTALVLTTNKTDSFALVDSDSLSLSKPVSDSFSFADSVSKAVTYSRAFSDFFILDDTATVDAISKNVDSDKTNILSLSDLHTLSFDKRFTDSFSFTESQYFSVDKPITDSFSLSENVTVVLLGGASSVLNTSALNTYTLNS